MQAIDVLFECFPEFMVELARPAENHRHLGEIRAHPGEFAARRDLESGHERCQCMQDRQVGIGFDRVKQFAAVRQAAGQFGGMPAQRGQIVDIRAQWRAGLRTGEAQAVEYFGEPQLHAGFPPSVPSGLLTGR